MSHLFLIKQTSYVTYNSVAEKCLQHPRIAYNVEFQSVECDIKGAMYHNNFLQNSQHSAKGSSKIRSHLSYDCRQCFLYLTLRVSREENQYSCGQQRSCLYTFVAIPFTLSGQILQKRCVEDYLSLPQISKVGLQQGNRLCLYSILTCLMTPGVLMSLGQSSHSKDNSVKQLYRNIDNDNKILEK